MKPALLFFNGADVQLFMKGKAPELRFSARRPIPWFIISQRPLFFPEQLPQEPPDCSTRHSPECARPVERRRINKGTGRTRHYRTLMHGKREGSPSLQLPARGASWWYSPSARRSSGRVCGMIVAFLPSSTRGGLLWTGDSVGLKASASMLRTGRWVTVKRSEK